MRTDWSGRAWPRLRPGLKHFTIGWLPPDLSPRLIWPPPIGVSNKRILIATSIIGIEPDCNTYRAAKATTPVRRLADPEHHSRVTWFRCSRGKRHLLLRCPLSRQTAPKTSLTRPRLVGCLKMESSKLIVGRANDVSVKDFAAMMITDHGAANLKLEKVAGEQKLSVPTMLDEAHRSELEKLAGVMASMMNHTSTCSAKRIQKR